MVVLFYFFELGSEGWFWIDLLSPPKCWNYRWVPPHRVFMQCWVLNLGSCVLLVKFSTNWTKSLVPRPFCDYFERRLTVSHGNKLKECEAYHRRHSACVKQSSQLFGAIVEPSAGISAFSGGLSYRSQPGALSLLYRKRKRLVGRALWRKVTWAHDGDFNFSLIILKLCSPTTAGDKSVL